MSTLRNALGMLTVITSTALGAARSENARADEVPDRDALWRSIFARPAEIQGGTPDVRQVALGADLFRDVRLSEGARGSCASCHDASRAFTDGRVTAQGPGGATLPRNSPQLYDLAWASAFFWDARVQDLGQQARFPILAKDELGATFEGITARLNADVEMVTRFRLAFPDDPEVSEGNIIAALVAYERSLVSPETRFDRWVRGEDDALSETELNGFAIFVGKGGCVACHGGWRFTDGSLHDIGLPLRQAGQPGPGVTDFKTPSLRELKRTAPYMHDGSKANLRDVVDHYAGGINARPSLAPALIRNLTLTDDEKNALVAFLETLSSDPQQLNSP